MNEEWRSAPGYEGYYEVSSIGRFRSVDRDVRSKNGSRARKRGRLLNPYQDKTTGYYQARVSKEGRSETLLLHRLVCEAFHGPPPEGRPQCAHWDGDPANNNVANLRWASPAENAFDKVRHGRVTQGTNANSKLTVEQVRTLRRRYDNNEPRHKIAADLGITKEQVWNIGTRRQWKHID